jgi:hypothetical protein
MNYYHANKATVSFSPEPVYNTVNATKMVIAVTSTITNINDSKIYSLPGNLITSQNVSEVPSDGRYAIRPRGIVPYAKMPTCRLGPHLVWTR